MRRLIGVLGVLLLLTAQPVRSQGQFESISLPDTTPPPLLLVILLDDSSTMTGQNSASTQGYRTGREATDPTDVRSDAVRHMVELLASDQLATHRVAVLSFGAINTADGLFSREWLTANPLFGDADVDPFIAVGGPGYAADADTGYRDLIGRLAAPRLRAPGPGAVGDALDEARGAIRGALGTEEVASPFKPAIILIADDVPMRDQWGGNTSPVPWFDHSRDDWVSYVDGLNAGVIAELQRMGRYQGYCQTQSQGEAGGVPVVPIALGAAVWINTDGSINPRAGNYYADLAQRTHSASLTTGQPLVYPVDPGLTEGADSLRRQLLEAGADALSELRCVSPVTGQFTGVPDGQGGTVYQMPVSNLYRQVRLVFELTSDQIVPRIRLGSAAEGYTRDDSGAGRVIRPAAENGFREIWTFTREALQEGWAGTWEIRFSGQAQVTAQVEVGLSDLSVDSSLLPDAVNKRQEVTLRLRLAAAGLDVIPGGDPLIAQVEGTLGEGDEQESFTFTADMADGRIFSRTLGPRSEANPGETLPLAAAVVLNGTLPGTAARLPILSGSIRITDVGTTAIDRPNIRPAERTAWDCTGHDDGTFSLDLRVPLRTDLAEKEGLYSYTRIDVYYPASPDADPAATPIAILRWQPEADLFAAAIDCARLTRQPVEQQLWLAVVFPDDSRLPVEGVPFILPLASPTPPPPTAAATAAPTPLPPQPGSRGPLGQLEPIFAPGSPGRTILFGVGGLVVLWVGVRGAITFRRRFLPLSYVSLRRPGEVGQRPLLALPWRYLPFAQRVRIYESAEATAFDEEAQTDASEAGAVEVSAAAQARGRLLFEVLPGQDGGLRIGVFSKGIAVENQVAIPRQPVLTRRKKTVIRVDGGEYTVFNRRGRL